MFQGCETTLQIPYGKKGMDATSNNIESSQYVENMLLTSNNMARVRHGTKLFASHTIHADYVFRKVIKGMSYIKENGVAEILGYCTYFTEIPDISPVHISVDELGINSVTIILTYNNEIVRNDGIKLIYDGLSVIFVQPSFEYERKIYNVRTEDDLIIKFNVDLNIDLLDTNEHTGDVIFNIWYERAAIVRYLEEDGEYFNDTLYLNLDANVIVQSINYQNKLIICNGVDNVLIYDGNSVEILKSPKSIPITGTYTIVDKTINFTMPIEAQIELDYIRTLNTLKLTNGIEEEIGTINDIDDDENNDGTIDVRIVFVDDIEIENINAIIYERTIPKFSHIEVGHGRLWALSEGRTSLDKFRDKPQFVYYTAKQQSYLDWYNDKTSDIDFIDFSVNNSTPDIIETIKFFEGNMLFICRNSTYICKGTNPVQNFDGEQVNNEDAFYLDRVVTVGIFQKNLCVDLGNELLLLSNLGKSQSFYINQYGKLAVRVNSIPQVRDFLEAQLSFVDNNEDYRKLLSFYYPYGDFIGIKILNDVLVFQNKNETGHWSVFNGNFADAKSFFYNQTSSDLYIGMDDGKVLLYADKLSNMQYRDYTIQSEENKKIQWKISSNWVDFKSTWSNEKIFLVADSMEKVNININIYINNSLIEPIQCNVIVNQISNDFDIAIYDIARFAVKDYFYAHEHVKFNADSIKIEMDGYIGGKFIFNKMYLAGGNQPDNLNGY